MAARVEVPCTCHCSRIALSPIPRWRESMRVCVAGSRVVVRFGLVSYLGGVGELGAGRMGSVRPACYGREPVGEAMTGVCSVF